VETRQNKAAACVWPAGTLRTRAAKDAFGNPGHLARVCGLGLLFALCASTCWRLWRRETVSWCAPHRPRVMATKKREQNPYKSGQFRFLGSHTLLLAQQQCSSSPPLPSSLPPRPPLLKSTPPPTRARPSAAPASASTLRASMASFCPSACPPTAPMSAVSTPRRSAPTTSSAP
jgi:hypothetical protein